MRVFIFGLNGRIGTLLAHDLQARGDVVGGLVRRQHDVDAFATEATRPSLGSLTELDDQQLAQMLSDSDAIVFAAGSNGGAAEVTTAVDGDGFEKAIRAARLAGVPRFVSVSVLPEAWRERELSADEEHYFRVKKLADVQLGGSGLDWIIVRPSLLVDEAGSGTVTLAPAGLHGQISRADVAATLAQLLHEPRIGRQILELDGGPTPIAEAVRLNVRSPSKA